MGNGSCEHGIHSGGHTRTPVHLFGAHADLLFCVFFILCRDLTSFSVSYERMRSPDQGLLSSSAKPVALHSSKGGWPKTQILCVLLKEAFLHLLPQI